MFLRPKVVSAKVERKMPPRRQPMKKEEAGRPVIKESLGFRCHSETMEESVKMVMKSCWESKNQAKETRRVWRNWERLNFSKQSSIVESLVDLGWERRGVEAE